MQTKSDFWPFQSQRVGFEVLGESKGAGQRDFWVLLKEDELCPSGTPLRHAERGRNWGQRASHKMEARGRKEPQGNGVGWRLSGQKGSLDSDSRCWKKLCFCLKIGSWTPPNGRFPLVFLLRQQKRNPPKKRRAPGPSFRQGAARGQPVPLQRVGAHHEPGGD